jgi:hypothetical protein
VQPNWTAEEESLITQAMAEGLSRIQAIQHLRSKWLIGETAPPGWKQARAMPDKNPWFGRIVAPSPAPVSAQVIGTAVCAGCGSLFSPSRANHRTCSGRCRKLASRQARVEPSGMPSKAAS